MLDDIMVESFIPPLIAGIMLAAATGLRAFLPLCMLAWAAYLDWIPLSSSFAWLDSLPAVVAFTAAVLFELAGDKIPAVDHLLDVLGTFVKPLAALVITAASVSDIAPLYVVIAAMIGGASIATGIHLVKAKGRLLANAATFGLAAPVVSLLEDGLSFTIVLAAIFVPIAAIFVLAGLGFLLVPIVRDRGRARSQHRGASGNG